jgi:callose synthase
VLLEELERRGSERAESSPSSASQHLHLLREQVMAFVYQVCDLIRAGEEGQAVVSALQGGLVADTGFYWDDDYACDSITALLSQDKCSYVLQTLYVFLTVSQLDAAPHSSEAKRRLLFFSNSLFMNMPSPPPVHMMQSWTVLTPVHSETIMFSHKDLDKETEDGIRVLFYLQTIYPLEWQNFCERVGVSVQAARVIGSLTPSQKQAACMWATRRGQTLGRTADGMMLYEKALLLLAKLENPAQSKQGIRDTVLRKFQFLVSAQCYGKQLRDNDVKARDITALLNQYSSLRVAYIDSTKRHVFDSTGVRAVDEYFSVLVKPSSTQSHGAEEVYRIRLPGNPVLGEGKPENQNHAIVFTRGEMLQAIDMNQSNYFEEALKMRNLLEEFAMQSTPDRPCAIVGFRENIFTGVRPICAYSLTSLSPPSR